MIQTSLKALVLAASFAGALHCTSAAAGCRTDLARSAPDSRYTDRGDGTVIDSRTGLQWYRCSLGETYTKATNSCTISDASQQSLAWQASLQAVAAVNSGAGVAGFKDWRSPNIKELGSILEHACTDPSINTTIFPNTASDLVWSSTPAFRGTAIGFPIDFTDGREVAFPVIENLDDSNTGLRTRLVRDAATP